MMERGQYRMAGRIYRQKLQADPADAWAPLGIARAQAATGRCDQALVTLEERHAGPIWDVRLAVAAARCHALHGDHADARYHLEEALLRSADNPAVLLRALVQAHASGDGDWVAELEHSIADLVPDGELAAFARGLRGLEEGDADRVFVEIRVLRAAPAWKTWSDLLATHVWLALDDPAAAVQAATAQLTAAPRPLVQPWLAEAYRRVGEPNQALFLLTTAKQQNRTDLVKRAFLIRAAADALADGERYQPDGSLQQLDQQATALLATHPLDADVIASAWYLARLTGDDARAAALVDRLSLVRDDAAASLARCVPLHLRTP